MPWMRMKKLMSKSVLIHLLHSPVRSVNDWPAIWKDILKRRFIWIGFSAFVLMIPLALTSTNAAVRKLGSRAWQRLHRLVYVIAICGVVHYWWLVKADVTKPEQYAFVLSLLLGYRIVAWLMRRNKEGKAAAVLPDRAEVAEG